MAYPSRREGFSSQQAEEAVSQLKRIADSLEKLYSIQMILHRKEIDQFPTNEMGRVLRCNLTNNRMLKQLKMAWDDLKEPEEHQTS